MIFVHFVHIYVVAALALFVPGLRRGMSPVMSVKILCVEFVNKPIMGRQLPVNKSIS